MEKLILTTALFSRSVGQDLFLQSAIQNVQPPRKPIRGVALNGLLQFEDWFFSWPQGLPPSLPYPFDEVSSGPTLPQGRRFPSEAVAPELMDPWFADGDLIGTTAARIGDSATIKAITLHRESYITEYDFAQMAAHSITHVRLAFGWWVFASNPHTVKEPLLISDPCYPEKRVVTVPGEYLTTLLEQGARHGIGFLMDMHSMPCGSSDGTYNGIYPSPPRFWLNETIKNQGLEVVRNMAHWWKMLPEKLQPFVLGVTVLNEPALGLVGWARPGVTPIPGGNVSVIKWLKSAVEVYRSEVQAHPSPPLVYMNLHESAFPSWVPGVSSSIDQMGSAYAQMGLSGKDWALFDVHRYFAWGGDGNGIPAQNCTTDEKLRAYASQSISEFTNAMQAAAVKYDMKGLCCSEWSLSMHHKDHISPCTAPNSLKWMYYLQVQAFAAAGMDWFFWGWRMPQGGVHEPMWSLKYHYTGSH